MAWERKVKSSGGGCKRRWFGWSPKMDQERDGKPAGSGPVTCEGVWICPTDEESQGGPFVQRRGRMMGCFRDQAAPAAPVMGKSPGPPCSWPSWPGQPKGKARYLGQKSVETSSFTSRSLSCFLGSDYCGFVIWRAFTLLRYFPVVWEKTVSHLCLNSEPEAETWATGSPSWRR